MKTSMFCNVVTVMITLISLSNAHAVTIQYAGTSLPDATAFTLTPVVRYGSSSGQDPFYFGSRPVEYNIATTVDTSSSTLTYDNLSIGIPGAGTINHTESHTVGFGAVADFTAIITLNPISWTLTDVGPLNLTPSTGGNFNVDVVDVPNSLPPIDISGDYVITGPTETVSNSFSFSAPAFFFDSSINTLGYPDQITSSFFLNFRLDSTEYIYDVIVDNVNLSAYAIGDVAFQLFEPATLSAVPIPPALWLFGSGLVGLVGIARRKKAA